MEKIQLNLINAELTSDENLDLTITVGDLIQHPNDVLLFAPLLYNVLNSKSKDPDTMSALQRIHLIGLLIAAISQDAAGTTVEDVLLYSDFLIASKAINKVANYDPKKVKELCAQDDPDPENDEAYAQILKDSKEFDYNIIREIKRILEDEDKQWIPVNKVKS